jgi:phage-related protein
MSLIEHRQSEHLGGVVYLLTIDMSGVTGNPTHVRRFTNNYGEDGSGITYQTNLYKPHPYEIAKVKKNLKANKSGSKLKISDNDELSITRFIEEVGGDLQGARILELKVYGRFLDTGVQPNILAYVKRLDHVVSYVEDSVKFGEIIIHTIDPLSREIDVPNLSFSAGVPNSGERSINIFPAVDRTINKER